SARKFGPAPLGGWCSVSTRLPAPTPELEGLAWRSLAARFARGLYLAEPAARTDEGVEAVYLEAFRAVEAYLDANPKESAAPAIAGRGRAGIDWEAAALRRRANWLCLRELLPEAARPLPAELPEGVVPLGLVVCVPERDRVRDRLARERIFCPVHWPVPQAVNA